MEERLIYGIQQIGVGVPDAREAFKWYATKLGADVSVFEDNNTATYMAPYMGGEPHNKRAILAVNMQGGSGYEIWQFTDREPQLPKQEVVLGDTGIYITFVKSNDIQKSYDRLKKEGVEILSDIANEPDGSQSFHIKDPYGNILRIKEFYSWYQKNSWDVGGNFGCVLGVSDIDKALKLYSDVLGYDKVVFDKTGAFDDLKGLPNGEGKFRRVLLEASAIRSGGFSSLFGESQLELIQSLDRIPVKIFENRFWGDRGFIHLCFDIKNMKKTMDDCANAGFPFTVISDDNFDMGDANGHWGYLEDPDGTLIEFVETHKVPVVEKLGLAINLKKRNPRKPLPNWMIKAMALKRVKF